jgi:perosamine synthetase
MTTDPTTHPEPAALQISKPYFSDTQSRNILAGISTILASGRLINGPFGAELESKFAARFGTRHAIAVNTCTSALQICLSYLEASGGEVLVPAASFTTDVSSVRWSSARPVLVDIDPETLSFDLADLERKTTKNTRGVLWVHLTGLIAPNYKRLVTFAKDRGLFLLEDCAHAQGARIDGMYAGAIGAAGCFSFFPTKLMTCGVGGMITTNDSALDRFAREMRFFGRSLSGGPEVEREGNDWLLDEFRACVALAQLEEFDLMLARRRAVAQLYDRALANQPGLSLVQAGSGDHAYYQYAILLDERLRAEEISKALKLKHNIEAKKIYHPLHQEKIFREYDDGTLKLAERTMNRSLCLPMHPGVSDDDANRAAAALVDEIRQRI